MNRSKCENCRYTDVLVDNAVVNRICRKSHPLLSAIWPSVEDNDWCGSFEALKKDEAENE